METFVIIRKATTTDGPAIMDHEGNFIETHELLGYGSREKMNKIAMFNAPVAVCPKHLCVKLNELHSYKGWHPFTGNSVQHHAQQRLPFCIARNTAAYIPRERLDTRTLNKIHPSKTQENYMELTEADFEPEDPWQEGGYLYTLDGSWQGIVVATQMYENTKLYALQQDGIIKSFPADMLCDTYDVELKDLSEGRKRGLKKYALSFLLVAFALMGTAGAAIASDTLFYEWCMAMYNNIQIQVEK